MLGVKTYPQDYIDSCRARVDADLAAYAKLDGAALADFAPRYFTTMVLALDHAFMHRLRGVEGKDGNPLNEVRLLTASVLEHGGVFTPDATIKYKPDNAVLKFDAGDEIVIDEAGFRALADGFFAEIQARFS